MKKGIILAGGYGTRLYPSTYCISKQLLPVYDKPMIYYPIATLMNSGIRDILIIVKSGDYNLFNKLLGDGSKWGIKISYLIQTSPKGIAHALIIAEDFIGNDGVTLILGDNIFWGSGFENRLYYASSISNKGATVFGYPVSNPKRYGVVEKNDKNKVISLEEKPENPKSNIAVTGVYCYDNNVVDYAKSLKPSKRGELEITDLNRIYLDMGNLSVEYIGRGVAWLDTGTHESLSEASSFVEAVQKRQGMVISSPEESALKNCWIKQEEFIALVENMPNGSYSKMLMSVLN